MEFGNQEKSTEEDKSDAVRLVLDGWMSVRDVAEVMHLRESSLRGWVQRAEVEDDVEELFRED